MENNFIMLSAIIDSDSDGSDISLPVNSTYSLSCKKYTISRKNIISKTACISKDIISDFSAAGKLLLCASGEIYPDSISDFIAALNALSTIKEPFTLVCEDKSYPNMVLYQYEAEIDSYGKYITASLQFIEV